MTENRFEPDDIVKTCPKIESGLYMSIEGLSVCTRGALNPPHFCSADEINRGLVTKHFIIQKRKEFISKLNDNVSIMDCKRCLMVRKKKYGDIDFTRLGHIDLQHYTICNLSCLYCSYSRKSLHVLPQYDALKVLGLFLPEDIEWDAHVDFAGGEPSLLENLEEFLEFFRSRRIRVLIHTNSVRFHQSIYNGLIDGTIYWVITSLDSGTPSTFAKLRGRNSYTQVLENITRYASAAKKGHGMLAVKYIFSDSNCSDDDIVAFVYTMLAIQPNQVWLNFDFTSLTNTDEMPDFNKEIAAYAKTYTLLKKHGVEAFHYFKENLATVSKTGKKIMKLVETAIEQMSINLTLKEQDLILPVNSATDFNTMNLIFFKINPLRVVHSDGTTTPFSLSGKRVILIPATPITQSLATDPDISRASWLGYADRNPTQHGKIINGKLIYGYEAIASLDVDVILVAPPEKHRASILKTILSDYKLKAEVFELLT